MKGRAEDLAWKSINEAPRFLDLSRKPYHEKFYKRTFLNDSPIINQAFSIFTLIYLVSIIFSKKLSWSYLQIALFAIFGSILTLFPLVELKRGDHNALLLAIQTSMLLISVIILEFVIGESKYLTPYFSLALIYRQIQREHVLDNIALCLVYTADVTIGFHDKTRFDAGKLLVWISLILGLSLGNAVLRIKRRLWEHLCVLLVFHLKCEEEAILGNAMVSAHFPQDLVKELVEDFVEEKRTIKPNHPPLQSDDLSNNKDNLLNHSTSQVHLPCATDSLIEKTSKSNANGNNDKSNNKKWNFFNFNRKLHPLSSNHNINNKSESHNEHEPLSKEVTNNLIKNDNIANDNEVDLELMIDPEENPLQITDAMTMKIADDTKDDFSYTIRSVTPDTSILHTMTQDGSPQVNVNNSSGNIDLIIQATNTGLIPKYTDPILSPEVIDSLTGVDSRYCTVIAIKLDIGEHSECSLNNIGKHVVYDIIDAAAEFHKIACVRKFGGTWIGCVGYFKSKRWETDSERNNCLHAIKLACEITKMAKLYNWSVCSAIDAGNIIGGFINDRMSFDLIGPEVRWVLNISDTSRAGEIYLSSTVHRIVQKCEEIVEKKLSINKNLVECSSDGNTRLYSVGVMHEELKLRKLEDILNLPELSQNAVNNEKAWSCIHKMSENLNSPIKSSDASSGDVSQIFCQVITTTVKNSGLRLPTLASATTTPNQTTMCPFAVLANNLSMEFRTSLLERYGVDTNTDILTELDDTLLDNKLHQLYLDLQKLVNEMCLIGMGKYFLMPSNLLFHVAGDDPIDTLPLPIDNPTTELNIFQCFLDSIPTSFIFPKYITLSINRFRMNCFARKRQIHVEMTTVADTATATAARIEYSQQNRRHGLLSYIVMTIRRILSYFYNIIKHISNVIPDWHHQQQRQKEQEEQKPIPDVAEVIQPHAILNDDTPLLQIPFRETNDESNDSTACIYSNTDMNTTADIVTNNTNTNTTSELPIKQISENEQKVSYFQSLFNTAISPTTQVGSSPSSPTIHRGWLKYYDDMSVLSHSVAIMYITLLIFSLVTFYVMLTPNISQNSYVFALFVACILLPFTIIYKRNNGYLILMPLIRGIFVLLLPVQFYCTHSTSTTTKDKNFQNQFLILAFFFIPEVVNHQVHVVFLEYGLYFVMFFSRLHFYQNLDPQCYISCYSTMIVCIRGFLIVTVVYTSQYLILLCYVVEHVLNPAAKESLRKQCEYTRSILQRSVRAVGNGSSSGGGKDTASSTKLSYACKLIFPRRYRNCAVVAIHIKAADVLPVVVRASESSEFLKKLYQVFDDCLRQCGLIKVTQFSGLVLAVACKGAILDTLTGMQSQISHTTRGVNVLRMIQKKLDEFNKKYNVSVMVGVGVNQGAVCMGFLGNARYCFDISGVTRDIACSMAINESNGMIVSKSFEEVIKNTINVENNERIDFIPSKDIMSTSEWIKVYLNGTSFNNVKLEDFEHVRLLGKGGYGSVHLVREKAFNIRYAVKVIPRTSAQNTKLIQRELHTLHTLTQLDHSHVVGFKYCLIREKRIYLVMTYIRGGNMSEIVERNKLTLADLRLWFAELVLALEYVHGLRIIHRDVKPANCMIGADGHLRLADFGLSKYLEPSHSRTGGSSSSGGGGQGGGGGHNNIETSSSYDTISGNTSVDTHSINSKDTMLFMQKMFPTREHKDIPLKVLVVENALNTETSLVNALRKLYIFQYILIASYGDNALRKIKENVGIDMIIVDVRSQLKEKFDKAIEAITQLQQDPAAKNLSIIAVIEEEKDNDKDKDKDDIREAVLQSGAMEVLETPLSRHRVHLLTLGQNGRQRRSSIVESEKSLSISATMEAEEEQEETEKEDEDGDLNSGLFQQQQQQQQQQEKNLTIKKAIAAAVASSTNPSTITTDMIPNKSCKVKVTNVTNQNNNSAIVGTLHYIAPEVIEHHHYSIGVDWWACGVTFYECTTRQRLFTGSCKKDVFENILKSDIIMSLSPLADLSPALERITKSFLQRDVKERLGSNGSSEIKSHDFFEDISWNSISKSDPPFKPAQNLEKVEDDGNQALARSLFYCNEDLKKLRSNNFHNNNNSNNNNTNSLGDRRGIKRNKKSKKDQIYNRSGILLSSMIDGVGFSINIPLNEVGEDDENQNEFEED